MKYDGRERTTQTRRDVVKGIGMASVSAITGGALSAVASASEDDREILGDFESGLDGWYTDGPSTLTRVTTGDESRVVSGSEHGLQVGANGDSVPLIKNTQRVSAADFVAYPHLSAVVRPGEVADVDSTVTFRFRFHHAESANPPGVDGEREQRCGGTYYSRVTSEEMEAETGETSVLTWDMSSIHETPRAEPERLEIFWYPTERPPREDAAEDTPGFDYHGTVCFDDISLHAERASAESATDTDPQTSLVRGS